MTVHQAKGLEFSFVFVSLLGDIQKVEVGSEFQIEDLMKLFRNNPSPSSFSAKSGQSKTGSVFFYVAYSRAIHSLVFLARNQDVSKQGIGFGNKSRQSFVNEVERL